MPLSHCQSAERDDDSRNRNWAFAYRICLGILGVFDGLGRQVEIENIFNLTHQSPSQGQRRPPRAAPLNGGTGGRPPALPWQAATPPQMCNTNHYTLHTSANQHSQQCSTNQSTQQTSANQCAQQSYANQKTHGYANQHTQKAYANQFTQQRSQPQTTHGMAHSYPMPGS